MSSLTLDLGNPVWISLRSAVLLLTKKEDRGVEDQVDIDWLESCVRSVGHLPLHPFRLSSDSAPSTRLNLPTHRATLFSYPILSVSSGSHCRTHPHPRSGSKKHTHTRDFLARRHRVNDSLFSSLHIALSSLGTCGLYYF